jgi:hypothetical protein
MPEAFGRREEKRLILRFSSLGAIVKKSGTTFNNQLKIQELLGRDYTARRRETSFRGSGTDFTRVTLGFSSKV